MDPELPASIFHHRLLRASGIAVWLILGAPIFSNATRKGIFIDSTNWMIWVGLFCIFGPAFWFSSSPNPIAPHNRIAGFLIQTLSVLGMTYIFQDYFVGFLLVVVSWLIALYLPWRLAVGWAVVQTVLLLYFLEPHYHMGWRWAVTSAYLGFQVFAITTAIIAKSEVLAREDLAQINAQLLSTRELLAESSRVGERVRITRELHDVLGHHLTALALQLEVTVHSSPDQLQESLKKSRASAGRLLEELRQVVNDSRGSESLDVRRAISTLADYVPRLKLHLELPEHFRITDAARAHAILRCVQEITTNTLKHADAGNLWITIVVTDGVVEISARDDGHGAEDAKPGIGLSGMRERLEQLGGGLSVELSKGAGFRLRAWLPVFRTMETT
jgi:signal transduction histidine kinase